MMNIFFLHRGKKNIGSNRIYIDNLSKWINEKKISTKVSNILEPNFSHYVLSKYSDIEDVNKIRSFSKQSKIGLIHPSDQTFKNRSILNKVDFYIVGSLEEKDYYLKYNSNIIRFPQIEEIPNYKKVHKNTDIIKIAYHGNLQHLEEMDRVLKSVLEKLSKNYKIKLYAVYDKSLGEWKFGRPNIDIEDIDWSLENLIKYITQSDIGIIPSTNNFILDSNIKKFQNTILKTLFKGRNGNDNDYIIRFKVTSNAGRAFVFHQLGIPVVADFWPSHFEILGNDSNGFIAHSFEGWYQSLEKLIINPLLRQKISESAQKNFEKAYDKEIWVNKFIDEIKKI